MTTATKFDLIFTDAGATLQTDKYAHFFDNTAMADLAECVNLLLGGDDTHSWDGDEPESRIQFTVEFWHDYRNGAYLIFDQADFIGIFDDHGWNNVDDLCKHFRKRWDVHIAFTQFETKSGESEFYDESFTDHKKAVNWALSIAKNKLKLYDKHGLMQWAHIRVEAGETIEYVGKP